MNLVLMLLLASALTPLAGCVKPWPEALTEGAVSMRGESLPRIDGEYALRDGDYRTMLWDALSEDPEAYIGE
ncbi:MAG: hypothetical protein AAF612_08040 [Planctomycetota bacterium]